MSDNPVLLAALKMPVTERAELARSILESLESDSLQEDVEQAWADEIARRLEALDKGEAQAIPADEVLARARKALTQP